MSNGPLPSTLVSMTSLPSVPTGSKVRFLGYVSQYTLFPGTLTLQHKYFGAPANPVLALVDVTLLLEGLDREVLETGTWVNVIGYIEAQEEANRAHKDGVTLSQMVRVKAIVLWSAGGVKTAEYERALEDRLAIAKR